ncbi:MAG: histidine triad nucleotide-binding protein [Bacillota bacterium]
MSDCVFCKIVNKEIPAQIVYEDEEIMAFKDIHPLAPIHILFIPKKHISDISQIQSDDAGLIGRIHIAAVQVARELGIESNGFRLVNNCRSHGGQEVYHLHFHLLGGRKLGAFVGQG